MEGYIRAISWGSSFLSITRLKPRWWTFNSPYWSSIVDGDVLLKGARYGNVV